MAAGGGGGDGGWRRRGRPPPCPSSVLGRHSPLPTHLSRLEADRLKHGADLHTHTHTHIHTRFRLVL